MSRLATFKKKYQDSIFESSCSETPEFKAFATAFKRALNADVKESSFKVAKFSKGHFELSGFLQHTNGQFVYWSIPDVRWDLFPGRGKVLYRTAKSDRDYTGGQNHFCSLERLLSSAETLVG